jgi:alpha-L-fucosidase 2
MLLQSHAGAIELLPALPDAWTEGEVSGLKARGGYEVGIAWKGGKLVRATLHATLAGAAKVIYGGKQRAIPLRAGQDIRLNGDLASIP